MSDSDSDIHSDDELVEIDEKRPLTFKYKKAAEDTINNAKRFKIFVVEINKLMSLIDSEVSHSQMLDHDGGRAIIETLLRYLTKPKCGIACVILTQILERYGRLVNIEELSQIKDAILEIKDDENKNLSKSRKIVANIFFTTALFASGMLHPTDAKVVKKYFTVFVEAINEKKLQVVGVESYITVLEKALKDGMTQDAVKKKLVDPYFGALLTKSANKLSTLGEFYLIYKLEKILDSVKMSSDDQNVLLSEKFVEPFAEFIIDNPPASIGQEYIAHLTAHTKRAHVTNLFNKLFDKTLSKQDEAAFHNVIQLMTAFVSANPTSELPLSNQNFLRSFVVHVTSFTRPKGKTKIDHSFEVFAKIVDKELNQNTQLLAQFISFSIREDHQSLRVHLQKHAMQTLEGTINLLKYALKMDASQPTALLFMHYVIESVPTQPKTYDDRADHPEEILSLLKLLYTHAYFTSTGKKVKNSIILNNNLPQEVRVKISKHLAQFLNNLAIQEFNHELSEVRKKNPSEVKQESPILSPTSTHSKITTTQVKQVKISSTRLKSWTSELINFDESVLSVTYERVPALDKEQMKRRKSLFKLLDKIKELEENNSTLVAPMQRIGLRILTSSMILGQSRNAAIAADTDDLVNFVKLITEETKRNEEDPEPIEILVRVMLQMLYVDTSLAYPCRIAFVTFSSDLNDECFRVMFSHLFHDGKLDEEREDDNEDTEMIEQGQNNKSDNKVDNSDNEQTGNNDNEQADNRDDDNDDDESPKENGKKMKHDSDDDDADDDDEDESSTSEEEKFDIDRQPTDEEMLRGDKMLSHMFELKKQKERKKKEANQHSNDYCIAICTLLEGLPFKHVRGDIIMMMYFECMLLVMDRINNPNHRIMERVCAMTISVQILSNDIIESVSESASEDKKIEILRNAYDMVNMILDNGLQARARAVKYEYKINVAGALTFLIKFIHKLESDFPQVVKDIRKKEENEMKKRKQKKDKKKKDDNNEKTNQSEETKDPKEEYEGLSLTEGLVKRIIFHHDMDKVFGHLCRVQFLLPMTGTYLFDKLMSGKNAIDKLFFLADFLKPTLKIPEYYFSEKKIKQLIDTVFDDWMPIVTAYKLEVKHKSKQKKKKALQYIHEIMKFASRLFEHATTRKLSLTLEEATKYAKLIKKSPNEWEVPHTDSVFKRVLSDLGEWMTAVGLEEHTDIVRSKRKLEKEKKQEEETASTPNTEPKKKKTKTK